MRFRFRDCVVDADRFELRRGGDPVEIQPKVLRLLLFLLENRERTLTKDEVLDAVWPDTATGESSLTRAVSFARSALGESQRDAEIIRTVRGRGYRIGVPVVEEPAGEETSEEGASASDFVCREKELGLARDALLQAIGGRGQVLLLVGEPGIGKTRLAEEVAAIARKRGARPYWGRCQDDSGAPAFWPWVQILRAHLEEAGVDAFHAQLGARASDVAEIVREVRERLPDLPLPAPAEPEQARFRLFDGVTRLFRLASAAQPLVLILDDLHSADESSLRLLEFLAPELRQSAVLMLATYRDVELAPGHRLEGTLAELARSQGPRRTVFLRGLTHSCVRRFTEHFAGIEPSEPLVEALHERTEGNPLFLVELLQWLQVQRPTLEEHGPWEAEIPEGVRQVIGHRLERLPEACNRTLERAAIIGRAFSLHVLARVDERSEEELLEHLEQAERTRIVEPVRDVPGRFRFTHTLIAETLRGRLASATRVRLHRRTANVLEELYMPRAVAKSNLSVSLPGSHLAELAYHFGEAAVSGDADKALDYSVRAGQHAMGLLAFEEAARHYERALGLLDLAGDGVEASSSRLLIALAKARFRSGDAAASARSLDRAVEQARASSDHEALAEAALRSHRQDVGGNVFVGDTERPRLLEEALAGLPEQDSELRARVMAAFSSELFFQGSDSRWRALSADALDMARRLGQPAALWSVLRDRPLWLLGPHQDEEREALVEEVFQLAKEAGDPRREFVARFEFRLSHAIEVADPGAIDRELAACGALADDLREPFLRWSATRGLAARALWQGRLAEAEKLLLEARKHGRRSGEVADLSYHSALLPLCRMQGRFAELEPALRADHRLPKDRGHKWSALALLLAESGRREDARAEFESLARNRFSAVRRDSNFTYNLALLAEACALLRDERSASELYETLLPYGGRYLAIPGIVAAGCASRFLGLLASTLGRFEEAGQHFDDALAVERRMGAKPFEAYAERDYAAMLLARGAPGDRSAASERLARATEAANELGLAGFA